MAQGRAGTGKSTMMNKFAVDWARNVLGNSSYENIAIPEYIRSLVDKLSSFEFLIPIKLRNVSKGMTLADVIQNEIPDLGTDVQEFCKYISKNQKSVLLLLDGFDEYDESKSKEITDIIKGTFFAGSCVVITTRPWKAHQIPYSYTDTSVEVQGFTKSSVKKYIKLFFVEDQELSAEKLIKTIEMRNLWHLASIPLVVQMMCILWKQEACNVIYDSITELYKQIICFILRKHLEKKGDSIQSKHLEKQGGLEKLEDHELMDRFSPYLLELGELAFKGLVSNKLLFDRNELSISNEAFDLGILAKKEDVLLTKKHIHVEFPHKSIQEMFAAFYIEKSSISEGFSKLKEHCGELAQVYDFQMVIIFLCGLSPVLGNKILSWSSQLANKSESIKSEKEGSGPIFAGTFQPSYYENIHKFTGFLMRCINEIKDKSELQFDEVKVFSSSIQDSNKKTLEQLFSRKHSFEDMKLLCLCDTVNSTVYEQAGEDLTEKSVTDNSLPSKIVEFIDMLRKIEILCLGFINFSSSTAGLATAIWKKRQLKTLCLVEAGLMEPDIRELVKSIPAEHLNYLNLSGNIIQGAAKDIARIIPQMPLRGITLIRAALDQTHVKELCDAITTHSKELLVLDLSRNNIGDYFLELCDSLPNLKKLKRLKMQDCAIKTEGFIRFVDILPKLKSIKELYLSWNPFDDGISCIKESIDHFSNLKTIHLLSLDISKLVETEIREAMKLSEPKRKIHISQSMKYQFKEQQGEIEQLQVKLQPQFDQIEKQKYPRLFKREQRILQNDNEIETAIACASPKESLSLLEKLNSRRMFLKRQFDDKGRRRRNSFSGVYNSAVEKERNIAPKPQLKRLISESVVKSLYS